MNIENKLLLQAKQHFTEKDIQTFLDDYLEVLNTANKDLIEEEHFLFNSYDNLMTYLKDESNKTKFKTSLSITVLFLTLLIQKIQNNNENIDLESLNNDFISLSLNDDQIIILMKYLFMMFYSKNFNLNDSQNNDYINHINNIFNKIKK